ncbi:hypothetical protein SAMN06295910_0129 [Allosphingosinicella indica]|uniref:Uncharacterized protein n=1 Tax=Allosphingosinicella indica TaxID=941907 RepID=A0A1X7FZH5_9SPHN|nr:hypothetical protein SAMN06295910_0129 [Allosphingosinicella indica]
MRVASPWRNVRTSLRPPRLHGSFKSRSRSIDCALKFCFFSFLSCLERTYLAIDLGSLSSEPGKVRLVRCPGNGQRRFGSVERCAAGARLWLGWLGRRLCFAVGLLCSWRALGRSTRLGKGRDMLCQSAADAPYHLPGIGERFRHECWIVHPIRDAGCEKIAVRAPRLERGLLAWRGDEGVMKADRRAEDLQLLGRRHAILLDDAGRLPRSWPVCRLTLSPGKLAGHAVFAHAAHGVARPRNPALKSKEYPLR